MEENTTNEESPVKSPFRRDAASFFTPGTIAERVELQLGVLTQGVVDCMLLASGEFPDLTEGPVPEPHQAPALKPGPLSSYQAARSAELRDAARLSEACARLLTGFAKLRGQFSQDFTIRHDDKRNSANPKARQRKTTITKRFSVPAKHAVSEENADPEMTAGLARGLAQVVESLAREKSAAGEQKESALDEFDRRFCRDPKDDGTEH